MSQKNLRKKRQSRAMPVETVQTRFKSSQFSQQKKISQDQNEIISSRRNKTYTKSIKRSAKCDVHEKKNHEPEETKSNREFHPDKLKRLFQKKEIVLKPKPAYKLVGGLGSINKRKLRKPTKEITKMEQKIMLTNKHGGVPINPSETKGIDVICLDDSDSLDEEDLMEILTCESPVWWEDPPDEYYDKEPLSIKMNKKDYIIKMKDQSICTIEEHYSQNIDQRSRNNISQRNKNIKKDNDFVARRNKLESLLGNIKSKKNNYDIFENTNNKSRSSSPEPKRQKKSSDSLKVLGEDLLKTFENIEIPIAKPKQEHLNVKVKETSQFLETKESNTESAPCIINKCKTSNIKPVIGLTIKKCDIEPLTPKLNNKKILTNHDKVQSVEEIEKNKNLLLETWSEQCDMKVLSNVNTETEVNQIQTKPSQTGCKVSGLTIKEFDPNLMIKQIKKRKRNKKSDKNARNKPKQLTTQTKSNSENPNTDDQVTVYKIISEEVEEYKDTNLELKTFNTQLNSYYNQCKNINKSKKEINNKLMMCDSDKQVCNNNETVKSIPVSNNETVKYCLQCSSIFDNDTCNYCAIKSNGDTKRLGSKANINAS